jgi:hypothetical protein
MEGARTWPPNRIPLHSYFIKYQLLRYTRIYTRTHEWTNVGLVHCWNKTLLASHFSSRETVRTQSVQLLNTSLLTVTWHKGHMKHCPLYNMYRSCHLLLKCTVRHVCRYKVRKRERFLRNKRKKFSTRHRNADEWICWTYVYMHVYILWRTDSLLRGHSVNISRC